MPSKRDRFWSKVRVGRPDECWPWHTCNSNGYGKFGKENAHREAYRQSKGPIPEGMCVRHKCDNRLCCNPSHLELGTIADNNTDCIERGRHIAPVGERHGRAKLTESGVREILNTNEASRVLAKRHGVSMSMVQKIRQGLYWRHLARFDAAKGGE